MVGLWRGLAGRVGLLLLALAVSTQAAVGEHIETVTAEGDACGKLHVLWKPGAYNPQVYRVLPSSQRQACSYDATAFQCSIRIKVHKSQRAGVVCVDLARMRLAEGATLYLSTGDSDVYKLTAARFRIQNKYKVNSWVKCFDGNTRVNLTFQSNCDAVPSHFFPQWVYVYLQPSYQEMIRYVDGTCENWERVSTEMRTITVRSHVWATPGREDDVDHKCSLLVAMTEVRGAGVQGLLCTRWRVDNPHACFLQAELRHSPPADFSHVVRCPGYSSDPDDCMEFEVARDVYMQVTRNGPVGSSSYSYLEMKANVTSRFDNFWNWDKQDTSVKEEEEEEDDSIYYKVFLPVLALMGLCICICKVSSRRAKNETDNVSLNGVSQGPEVADSPAAQPESVAMEPFLRPSPSPSWGERDNGRSDGDLAIPSAPDLPPDYSNVMVTGYATPSPRQSHHGDSAALPSAPPPGINDMPSSAPPTYDELFPSRS